MLYLLHNTTAFLLILCVVFALSSSINSQPAAYATHSCLDQSNETANADYKSNLTVLLESLSSKASQNYSFYNESSNIGIHGLYLCRGDVSNETCQICLSYATQDITTRCASNKSAIIWYDKCMLRYSNVSFFGVASWSPAIIGQNTANQPDFYSLTLLDSLIKRVNVAEKLYDTDNLTVILSGQSVISYGLVQCTRDIDGGLCLQCLNGLMGLAKNCCQAKIGWRILAPSCNLRYENQSFTDQPPATPLQPPPPPQSVPPAPQPPPGNGKSYRFGISWKSTAQYFGLIKLFNYYILLRFFKVLI